ncbi:MAG: DUF4886 domain-containing protein [Candidatus Omnitrophica bacterium]|nr:DUF4886 domain-containing protein [Candidatus Omnitrophota bacterium]
MNIRKYCLLKYKLPIWIALILLCLPLKNSFSESSKIHVLFIGNSLTYVNDLPGRISQLAKTRNIVMEYEMYAPGGYRLYQHASDPVLSEKIKKGIWDFVVLQEQSQWPALEDKRLEAEVYVYAQSLCETIRESNPKAHVVFYMTMAKKDGDPDNARYIPEVATYEGMQDRINNSYIHMAEQNHGIIAPVGFVWQNVRKDQPSIVLYADDKHPNITGSYLAACVFFEVLFKDSPVGLPHPQEIDDNTASYLQKMTEQAIQKQSWDWEQ